MLPSQPPPVAADLRVLQGPSGAAAELRLRAPPSHPLRWTLDAQTGARGGRSHTRQSGTAAGGSSAPVARLWIGPEARGVLTLTVSDVGGVRVRQACRLGPSSEKAPPEC